MNSIITATVLFTDVVSSTRLRTRQGDVAAHVAMLGHEGVIREAIARHDGREVKTIGDGFMVAFGSARQSVACAIAIQRGLAARRREGRRDAVHVRIGIHTGDAIEDGDDLVGAAVDAATRIMARAKGGEILISEMVRGVVGCSSELNAIERGRFALKGFDTRWRLYEVPWREEHPAISRRDLAVVVTDVQGSTATTDRLGDDEAYALLRAHNALIRAQATAHAGVIVKSMGDGFILSFERPADALACAVAIQRCMADFRREQTVAALHVGVAIHAGRFIVEADDLFGKDLFVAFRVLANVVPDGVLVTEAFRERLPEHIDLGPPSTLNLAGIAAAQTAYAVDWRRGVTTETARPEVATPDKAAALSTAGAVALAHRRSFARAAP